jgi:hypothetical protein
MRSNYVCPRAARRATKLRLPTQIMAPGDRRRLHTVHAGGGGTITIPPGIYAINATISLDPLVRSSINIRGCDDTTLVQTAGAEVSLFGIGGEHDECGHVVLANL